MKYKPLDKVRIKSLDWYNENKDNYGAIYAGNGFCFWKNMTRHCGEIMKITTVKVDPEDSNKGFYFMENSEEKWTDEMIEGLVEEEVGLVDNFSSRWVNEFNLPNGYIFKDENGNVINATKIVLEKKKKEYPKTYEECYKIMGVKLSDCYIQGYKSPLLEDLQELLICRDAYWKIAGDWKPEFRFGKKKYRIMTKDNKVISATVEETNRILTFPTEEMRDAFYENFKELINSCKELL